MFWQSAPAIAQADAPEPALSEQSDADQPFASDAAAILLFGKISLASSSPVSQRCSGLSSASSPPKPTEAREKRS